VVLALLTRHLLTCARREEIVTRGVRAGRRVIRKENKGKLSSSTRKSNNKPSNLDIKTLESVVVADKESNQCVPPHVTPASTSTRTYVYHQGHCTTQDVGDDKWLESLARYALFDQQFMPDTERVVPDSGVMMGIIPGAQGNVKYVQLTAVTGHTTSAEVADVV
jgi:hypothetical protein